MPTQKRLWLDEEKRLFPGPNHSRENHQEKPTGLQIDGVFDLSTEDDQLVLQTCAIRTVDVFDLSTEDDQLAP
ncbi:MAG TPA: hypothetical protein VF043_08810 [Ktedonobacteraceae bacterium]